MVLKKFARCRLMTDDSFPYCVRTRSEFFWLNVMIGKCWYINLFLNPTSLFKLRRRNLKLPWLNKYKCHHKYKHLWLSQDIFVTGFMRAITGLIEAVSIREDYLKRTPVQPSSSPKKKFLYIYEAVFWWLLTAPVHAGGMHLRCSQVKYINTSI